MLMLRVRARAGLLSVCRHCRKKYVGGSSRSSTPVGHCLGGSEATFIAGKALDRCYTHAHACTPLARHPCVFGVVKFTYKIFNSPLKKMLNILIRSSIDKLFGQLPRVDMLLIDTEGNDPLALLGAASVLKTVRYLEFENHKVGQWLKFDLQTIIDYLDNLIVHFDC